MHALTILENLSKLEKLSDFISILSSEENEIEPIKNLLKKILLKLASNINTELSFEGNKTIFNTENFNFRLSDNIKVIEDIFAKQKIKGLEQLIIDIKILDSFLENYQNKISNEFSIFGTEKEIMNLKEKAFLIFAERIF